MHIQHPRSLAGIFAIALIAVLALWGRSAGISRRPMHNDEANQAYRSGLLLETGEYNYDPDEHHGPSLYYLTLPSAWMRGQVQFSDTEEGTYRVIPVLFSVALILALVLVADGLGWIAVVSAALFLATSPMVTYYSRFYIQESLLVCFTFGAVACGWRYVKAPSLGWALGAGASIALMHATKETCVIAWAGMAAGVFWALGTREGSMSARLRAVPRRDLLGFSLCAIGVSVLLFSSFFTHWRGVPDSVLTYAGYLRRSGGGAHLHRSPLWYLRLLLWQRHGSWLFSEALIVVPGLVGMVLFLWKARWARSCEKSLARFLAVFTLVVFLGYSLIGYKTPWCALTFHMGFALLAGALVQACWVSSRAWWGRALLVSGMVLGLGNLVAQSCLLNGRYNAVEWNPYAYVHTSTDYLKLVRRVEDLAAVHPLARKMTVVFVTNPTDAWPAPWYLRKYPNVGYWVQVGEAPLSKKPSLVIASTDMSDAVAEKLGETYQVEYYGLRPEVLLTVYIRQDLWQALLQSRTVP